MAQSSTFFVGMAVDKETLAVAYVAACTLAILSAWQHRALWLANL